MVSQWQSLAGHPRLYKCKWGFLAWHGCPPTRTHMHLHMHTSPLCRSAPKSRTPPTQTLIGSCVPVPRYIAEQVLAICTVNQAHKTITDFSCMGDDAAELLISAWTAQASHTFPINMVLSHCVLEKCYPAILAGAGLPAQTVRELPTPRSPWLPLVASPHTSLSPSPLPLFFAFLCWRAVLFLPQPTVS